MRIITSFGLNHSTEVLEQTELKSLLLGQLGIEKMRQDAQTFRSQ